jgi:PAS domain S-box-containing protein
MVSSEENPKELRRILLIEDNPADARLVEIYLKEATAIDYQISKADELQKGLQKLEEDEFDAILLDLTLPDSQGFNTIKTMIEEFPEYTIIVMTGLEDETIAINSVKAGAQDFIVKGQFDGNLLNRTITYALERHHLQKRLEDYAKAIKTNEQRLIDAQKMARIGNWELDIVTNGMFWSDEVYRILGYDAANFEPSLAEYLKYVHPEDIDRVNSEIKRTMEKGAQYRIEYRLNLPDGMKVVSNQGQIQMSQKSGSIVLVGTIQDITTFRIAEEDEESQTVLGESKRVSEALLNSGLEDEQRALVIRLQELILQMAEG